MPSVSIIMAPHSVAFIEFPTSQLISGLLAEPDQTRSRSMRNEVPRILGPDPLQFAAGRLYLGTGDQPCRRPLEARSRARAEEPAPDAGRHLVRRSHHQ